MESFINPIYYVGQTITKSELLNIVSNLLNIPPQLIRAKNNKPQFVDARIILVNEIRNRSSYSIEDIITDLNIEIKRSAITLGVGKFKDKYNYDKEFKDKVDKIRTYLQEINVNEKTKII